ncbi:DUF6461 domain-containing protein [Nonomuraea sp. GTA35]|uniref:DUF6461 domain-containing protein n=1 Tax=Nonomuraea sp. GTA35 TaxID=1676746 RepID=UPI0035BED141
MSIREQVHASFFCATNRSGRVVGEGFGVTGGVCAPGASEQTGMKQLAVDHGVATAVSLDAPFRVRFALSQSALMAHAEAVARSGTYSHECQARAGPDPDRLVEEMRKVGLDPDHDWEGPGIDGTFPRSFALAKRITGFPFSKAMLEMRFLAAVIKNG